MVAANWNTTKKGFKKMIEWLKLFSVGLKSAENFAFLFLLQFGENILVMLSKHFLKTLKWTKRTEVSFTNVSHIRAWVIHYQKIAKNSCAFIHIQLYFELFLIMPV